MILDGRPAVRIDELPGSVVVLYRLYDSDAALLYVGITANLHERLRAHRSRQPWWPTAAWVTTEPCASARDALRAEAAAIEKELPRWNRQGAISPMPGSGPRIQSARDRVPIRLDVLDRELAARGWSRHELARQAEMNVATLREVYRFGWASLGTWVRITAALDPGDPEAMRRLLISKPAEAGAA